MPRLLIVKGPNRGISYDLSDRTRIGRLGENEIQVADPNVSRLHAEIVREAAGHVIYDRGSKNGITVNGKNMAESRLTPGDLLTIGSATFVFDSPVTMKNARFSCTSVIYLPNDDDTAQTLELQDETSETGWRCAGTIAELCLAQGQSWPATAWKLCQALKECFGALHAALLLRDYAEGELNPIEVAPRRVPVIASPALLKRCLDAKEVLFGKADLDWDILANILEVTGDADEEPGDEPAEPRRAALNYLLSPVQVDAGVNGVLMIVRDADNGFSQQDAEALRASARLVSLAIKANKQPVNNSDSDNTPMNPEQRSASTRSLRMQEIYNSARRSASGGAPILITGETGTGKETLARFIHESSERAAGPFVTVQCSAIPAEDLERVLFGEELPDESGDELVRLGKIDEAAGGTLFLQEVSELDLAFQPKLLRFLQDHAYVRVNSDCAALADVKVLASSSIDLAAAVRGGNFREDLWYRLNVVPFHMPPLRERREDIGPLLDFFLHHYSAQFNRRIIGANDSAISLLQKYDWPGNIRELNNAVERAVLLAESKVLSTSDFSHIEEARRQLNAKSDLERKRDTRPLAEVERQHIIIALKKHNFNQARAAEALGLHRNTLRNKIIEYGIEIPK